MPNPLKRIDWPLLPIHYRSKQKDGTGLKHPLNMGTQPTYSHSRWEKRNKESQVGRAADTYTHAHIAANKKALLLIGKHEQL